MTDSQLQRKLHEVELETAETILQKEQLTVAELRRPWFRRPASVPTLVVAAIAWLGAWQSGIFDDQKKKLEGDLQCERVSRQSYAEDNRELRRQRNEDREKARVASDEAKAADKRAADAQASAKAAEARLAKIEKRKDLAKAKKKKEEQQMLAASKAMEAL